MKLSHLIIITAIVCTAQAQAQNTTKKDSIELNRELTLEKEYSPTIRDASKVSVLPELKEPEAPKSQVEYAKFSIPYEVAPQLVTLPSGSYFTDILYSKKRGYVTAGVGSFVDIDGDLGYQILNSSKDRLSIFGSHRSSNGNVDYLQIDEKQKMKINDNLGGLNFVHDFGGTRLNAGMKYTYSAFNYYGYFPELGECGTPPIILPQYTVDKDLNQVNNMFEANAGFINDRPNELNYSFNLGYSTIGQKYSNVKEIDGMRENRFMADMDIHKGFNTNLLIGFAGYLKSYSYTTPDEGAFSGNNNYSNLLLNPYFGVEGDNWDLRLGVKVNLGLGITDYNTFAPDIKFNYRPSEKFKFYINMDGGVTDNGKYSIFYENRYVNPNYRIRDSKTVFDGMVGIQASPVNNLWFDIFTGYKITNDEHFWVSDFPLIDFTSTNTLLGENMLSPNYNDAKTFKLGGAIKYNFQDIFDIGLKATYYNWKIEEFSSSDDPDYLQAWNKPTFEADLTAGYNIAQIPLRLDAIYHLEAGRKAYEVCSGSVIDMKSINNLSIRGTYTFNETFSIFAKANNLLFQKYDIFYGYPAQNFSIMGGISIKF